jgi:superfamily II DNA/RNA helicase
MLSKNEHILSLQQTQMETQNQETTSDDWGEANPTSKDDWGEANPTSKDDWKEAKSGTKDDWEKDDVVKDSIKEPENKNIDIDEENNILTIKKFEDMGLEDLVQACIFGAGYVKPAPFQRTIIPTCIANPDRHSVVEAATGSGKTLCYLVVLANRIKPNIKKTQGLILATSRELADQIYKVGKRLFENSVISVAFHRGTTAGKQGVKSVGDKYFTTNMDHFGNEHIVISTPQRCLALLREQTFVMAPNRFIQIKTQFIQEIVLDECDKMLSTSERHNDMATYTHEIMDMMPEYTRRSLYSATMSENIKLYANEINAMHLKFVANEKIGKTVMHYWVGLQEERDKFACLENILREINNAGSVFIFASSIISAEEICRFLVDENCSADFIHGSLPQTVRDNAIDNFRNGKTRILVSTELAARGIDVNSVDLVFNFDLPSTGTDYMHRSGRAGRFGKQGIAISFVLLIGNARPIEIIRIEKENNIMINHLPELKTLKL